MRRALATVVFAAASLVVTGANIAGAETQQVAGTGDITKIIVDNGQTALTTRVFGLEAPCGGARDLEVLVENRRGRTLFFAQGTCTAGQQWDTALYSGGIQNPTPVRCRNFEFARNRDTGAYRVFMPRGCLDTAPDRIRVEVYGTNYDGSTLGGEAGPTRLLARG